MKDKLRVMIKEDFDEELNAMNVCVALIAGQLDSHGLFLLAIVMH